MQPHRRQEQSKSFAHYLWGESIYALLGKALTEWDFGAVTFFFNVKCCGGRKIVSQNLFGEH